MAIRVVCRNPECGDSAERNQAAPAMTLVNETASAWVFICLRCQREGRQSPRVVTKNLVGGTFGAGRRDDGTGPHGGKGPSKWRAGMTFK